MGQDKTSTCDGLKLSHTYNSGHTKDETRSKQDKSNIPNEMPWIPQKRFEEYYNEPVLLYTSNSAVIQFIKRLSK